MCALLSVPKPVVVITTNRTGPLYAGTGLTLTCTMTLHPNVDSDVTVSMVWNGPSTSTRDLNSLTSLHMSGRSYTRNLTISPLVTTDSGRYQCSVTITSRSSETFNQAINYSAISIAIVCK